MGDSFKIPSKTRIGHVHLKVSNLEQSLDFYCGLLGFEMTTRYGKDAAFISAGGYHHHIGLNTWLSKDASPAKKNTPWLFHVAIVLPTRSDLAKILKRIVNWGYPLLGASDHGVSEAIYLEDPDKNGIELYWDRPKTEWPQKKNGKLEMFTRPLDVQSLLDTLK